MKATEQRQALPSVRSRAFDCPHCGIRAHQIWFAIQAAKLDANSTPTIDIQRQQSRWKMVAQRRMASDYTIAEPLERIESRKPVLIPIQESIGDSIANVWFAQCHHCGDFSVWIFDRMVWPDSHSAPSPHPDMPDEVRSEYEEARAIVTKSPRGAAALLRLSIELLCGQLSTSGNTLNDKIAALVSKGLPVQIQQALDAVRVVGNNAVHPGEMNVRDDPATAESLFALVNFIVEEMITKPKEIAKIYGTIPRGARQAIKNRDANG